MNLPPLVTGVLIRRYKRFLADISLEDGREITAHCANPGSMLGLAEPGSRVWLSHAPDPKRKLAWNWELVEVAAAGGGGALVGLHTGRANAIVEEALRAGAIPELAGYAEIRREVAYGTASRVDFRLEGHGRPPAYVEVKSVTLSRTPGLAEFPDARTQRGTRHLADLAAEVAAGNRAMMLFLVQRGDCDRFTTAADIDPTYASGLSAARAAGVEVLVRTCAVTPGAIRLDRAIES